MWNTNLDSVSTLDNFGVIIYYSYGLISFLPILFIYLFAGLFISYLFLGTRDWTQGSRLSIMKPYP